MQKIKEFLATKTGEQIYSFVKTYFTVFFGIVLFAHESGVNIFTKEFILSALMTSLVSVIRNIYKFLTESKTSEIVG
jgi:hypothetical protein